MEKLFTPCKTVLLWDRKAISCCSALNLFYTLCIWWTKDLSCCLFTQNIQSCSMLTKGKKKKSRFMFFKNYVSLPPLKNLEDFFAVPLNERWCPRNSNFLHLVLVMEPSYFTLLVVKQQRSCGIILMNLLGWSFWILWQHGKWPYSPLLLGFSCPAIFFSH